jgi:deazaflavin-dependent oxidoreductase (nitroreductase family)
VLTTTGAKSGARHSKPLMAVRDGDDYVVIASNAGLSHHPGWYYNIRAHPEGRIEVDGRAIDVRGRVATPEERARLWPDIVARFPNYGGYQEKTTREIPLVILEAMGSGGGTGAMGAAG